MLRIFMILLYSCEILTRDCTEGSSLEGMDILEPYSNYHNLHRHHRSIRSCQSNKYGPQLNITLNSQTLQNPKPPLVQYFTKSKLDPDTLQKQTLKGHYAIIYDPARSMSVYEPIDGGCNENKRSTVADTARMHNCIIATNAGLFNTTTGACLGNIISDEKMKFDSGGILNPHFGILKNGQIFTGYLSEESVSSGIFQELVGGVIWLVRDGKSFVNESMYTECPDTQETGNIQRFVNVVSARTTVGVNKDGNVILLQVDGKTGQNGMNLWELADLMIQLGAVSAVNMDGGGSSTYFVNGSVINYPSDECPNQEGAPVTYKCSRRISSILCVHGVQCSPSNCNNHGTCSPEGLCQCYQPWTGSACDILDCGLDQCNGRGKCTEIGCQCEPGWTGQNCEKGCLPGFWGPNCKYPCSCLHGSCNSQLGTCQCETGYTGKFCDQVCPPGWYGKDCSNSCSCSETCSCNHITGICSNVSSWNNSFISVATCLANRLVKVGHVGRVLQEDRRLWIILLIITCSVALVSLIFNVMLVCYNCSFTCTSKGNSYKKISPEYDQVAMLSDDEDKETTQSILLSRNF